MVKIKTIIIEAGDKEFNLSLEEDSRRKLERIIGYVAMQQYDDINS